MDLKAAVSIEVAEHGVGLVAAGSKVQWVDLEK
jgi:hypothetical protein